MSPQEENHLQDLENVDDGRSDSSSVDQIPDNDIPGYFHERNDRLYHSHPTSPYPLPVDTPEQQRLTVNHKVLEDLIGGNYRGPVNAVLALNQGRPTNVLDLCTGNGQWVLDMAGQFPHAQFIGVDIVPIATRYPPANVQFEICDANARLRWADSHFDLIHARDVLLAVPDYGSLLDEAARLLRPGGLFLSVEWSKQLSFHPDYDLNVEDHAPATLHFFNTVNHILSDTHGISLDAADIQFLITNSAHFFSVTTEEIYVPVGTWHENDALSRIGSSFRAGQKKMANSFKQMLLDSEMSVEEVETLIDNFSEEMYSVEGLVMVAHVTHAQRA